ncbi:MAG: type II toxin-antitoxin system PemK/MazF family toxin [Propionibacteriaceae bacterium]|jgi:mRNA interferase MazF|nr:type II toxin-antitoxin system PemK/MazF family toxin [Propionibacteriaceae bacterium]
MTATVPGRGDVVWLSLDPAQGHEQRGHRPHLVLSNERLARTMGLVIAVPMTSVHRPWATRVELGPGSYAIGEQPRTFALSRVTKINRAGLDVGPVVQVVERLIGG